VFIDARDVADGTEITADLCIVGAGAAGITIARELASSARRIVLLESGFMDPDTATQALYDGASHGIPYFPLGDARTRTRQFGGSTNLWNGECRPLAACDFETRSWVPDSGWPFDVGQLRPYYERAQAVCGLGPFAYTVDDASFDDTIEPTVIQYSAPTRFGPAAYDAFAAAPDTSVVLGANAVELVLTDSGRAVQRIAIATLAGIRVSVRAEAFVLAAGGIENARLLLASDRVARGGIGNAHDLVGRCFMEHLYVDDGARIALHPDVGVRYAAERRIDGRVLRLVLTLSGATQQSERLPGVTFVVGATHTFPPRGPGTVRTALRRAATALRSEVVLPVKHVQEQVPNRDSRVVLSTERDRLGSRRAALDWRVSAIDKQAAARAYPILDRALRTAGVGRVVDTSLDDGPDWPARLRGARHHMGTTRMHANPARGVVDADCRVHGVANLFVAGSSVFPTSGSANPTLTIVALALRLADHLKTTPL